jgi:hypothetical protein
MFLVYSEIYYKLAHAKITADEKAFLSDKLRKAYYELRAIRKEKQKDYQEHAVHHKRKGYFRRVYNNIRKLAQKEKKTIIEDIQRMDKEKNVHEYRVKPSKQNEDLTKRYNILAKKIDHKLNVHEQISLFMEYYNLYSDLADSLIGISDKRILSEKLKELYKKLKSYNS